MPANPPPFDLPKNELKKNPTKLLIMALIIMGFF